MLGNHKSNNWFLLGIVALVIGTGATTLGYIVAGTTKSSVSSMSWETLRSEQQSNHQEQNNQTFATYTLVEFLDTAKFDNFLERSSALYDMFANVDANMLQEYWEQAQNLETSNIRDEIQDVIIQRWSVLDPMAALDVIESDAPEARKQVLFESVFHEWSLIDLENASNHVGNLEKDAKLRAVASIVKAREDMTYKQRREFARQFECEWVAIDVLRKMTNSIVIAKPDQEWRSFVWENKDDLQNLSDAQNRMLGLLAYSWIVHEGIVAFEKIRHSLPSDFSLLETTRFVSSELIEPNPQLAFDLVLAGKQHEKDTA